MARAAVAILLSAALAGVLAGRGGTQSGQRLLATIGQGSATRLTVVDPLTLAPVDRSTQIGHYTWPWALSPDGTQIVLARQFPAMLRFVDLRTMRTVRAVRLTGETSVESINWVSPRLLLAAVDTVEVMADARSEGGGSPARRPIAPALWRACSTTSFSLSTR